jgi:hypothetical protein
MQQSVVGVGMITWEGNVGAPFPGKSVVSTLDRSKVYYTFVYAYISDVTRWRGSQWRTVKKEFPTIDEASTAAGQWMKVCFEHGCPVAIAVKEVE